MNKDQYGIEIPALPRLMRRLDAVCLCRAGGGNNPMSFGKKKAWVDGQMALLDPKLSATDRERMIESERLLSQGIDVPESQRWFYNSRNTGPVNTRKKRPSSSRTSILST